ncbi:hypothetical protein AB0H77_27060 [Streptomyces sp. NPDC050844]
MLRVEVGFVDRERIGSRLGGLRLGAASCTARHDGRRRLGGLASSS